MPHPFDRYRPFTDVAALKRASEQPLRRSVRVNLLKSSVADFLRWAEAKRWQLEPVPWCPEGFFVDRADRDPSTSSGSVAKLEALGKDLLHLLGHTYLQEAASMLPVTLLDPQPGETVLDMSAAPGSKTTQIASQMRGEGIIVANDVQEKRLWSLLSNLQRSGVLHVIVTKKVGQWFARNTVELFDRVLCDAPCTAQGTVRKDTTALDYASSDNIGKMARLQRELLEAAVHAAKVGGRIVYSTCTLTPEENEEVVSSVLNKFSDQLEVVDPRELRAASFERSELQGAVHDSFRVQESFGASRSSKLKARSFLRLWPQIFDTEGFFCAVLRKMAPTGRQSAAGTRRPGCEVVTRAERSEPLRTSKVHQRFELLPKARRADIANRLDDWYGTSFLREEEILFSSKENLFVTGRDVLQFDAPVQWYSIGLPFGKLTREGHVRLSHEVATLRGLEASRQMIDVDQGQLRSLLQGQNLKHVRAGVEPGDVVLTFRLSGLFSLALGRGLFKGGDVLNRLPREIVRMFA